MSCAPHIPLPTVAGLAASLLLAAPAGAEGARLVIDCTRVTRCSADGRCLPAEGRQRIVLMPQGTDAAGAGSYAIALDDAPPASATSPGFTGPFVWDDAGGARRTFVLTGAADALLVRQPKPGVPASGSEIDLMTCESPS